MIIFWQLLHPIQNQTLTKLVVMAEFSNQFNQFVSNQTIDWLFFGQLYMPD
jgi:hypothetical protein